MTSEAHQLDALRARLDELDRALLATAAERIEVVRRIASVKTADGGGRALFDRERERAVYERARGLAESAGLDPTLARRLIEAIVEHSHDVQESASREVAQKTDAPPARFLVVGGGGRMGRFLVERLTGRGHDVDVLEAADGRDRVAAVAAAEIVIVSVPMHDAVDVAREIAPHVAADALLCDVNSLKEDVCAAMAESCRGEVLGLHPMFGPTVGSLRRQKIVVCPVRPGPRAGWLLRELGQLGAELIETDPASHDRMMAVIQVLVHFSTLVMGRALSAGDTPLEETLRFTSPIYRLELAFIGRLFAQDWQLYAEIEMSNPRAAAARRRFLDAAAALDRAISTNDREAFQRLFEDGNRYFAEFADEAMALSDHIIDALVRRP